MRAGVCVCAVYVEGQRESVWSGANMCACVSVCAGCECMAKVTLSSSRLTSRNSAVTSSSAIWYCFDSR